MIPADDHTKLLERRIHNQRVQLRWWTNWDGNRWGFTYMRRLHRSMMNNRANHAERRRREIVRLVETYEKLEQKFAQLRDAITDALPGLASIDDGTWHEYTGDLVLKEDQWNAIVAATRELRVALAGGEATSVTDVERPI